MRRALAFAISGFDVFGWAFLHKLKTFLSRQILVKRVTKTSKATSLLYVIDYPNFSPLKALYLFTGTLIT